MLTDNSPMPYGKFKGTKMANVPAQHLKWLYENNRCSTDVREYIKENSDVLNIEIKREENENSNFKKH